MPYTVRVARTMEGARLTPVVRLLLVSNVLMFVLQNTLYGLTELLMFVPVYALFRPWTVLTYMFLHGGMMHLLFNMLGLLFFGSRVEDRLGPTRFTINYFLSGFTGALISALFSPSSPIIGASAGVFGVMLAFAHFWPDEPIMIWGIVPVPARVLVIFTTILALFSGFGGAGRGIAHFAHLGGYAGAWAYLRWLERGRHEFKKKLTTAPKEVVQRLDRWKAIDLNQIHPVNRQEVARLLEKVERDGVGALTGPERLFLNNFIPPDA